VPVVDGHYDGRVSFLRVLAKLKASSKRIVEAAGGHEVPILLFLDWPTNSIDRYYALPLAERRDYIRLFAAEADALGMVLAVLLATTTDTNTARALGMLDFLKQLRGFHAAHARLYLGAESVAGDVAVSAPNVVARLTSLPNGQTVLHVINHNYSAGVIPQSRVTVAFALTREPATVTLASPDSSEDADVPFASGDGRLSITLDSLGASAVVWVH
jgi:hypothetical protein